MSLRASRTGSGCSMDSSIRSLCQRMRWHSSMMILIATFGSRSRKARKSSRRSTNSSVASPAVASAVRLWPSSTATSPKTIAGAHEVQGQAAAVGGAGLDPDLAAADPVKGVAGVALLEQRLAERQLLGVAEAGDSLQFVGAKVREHRVHLQNNRKFGLFAHWFAFQIDPKTVPKGPSKIHPERSVS